MTKRVLGVLAALSIVAGSAACSSSSSPATPAADAGTDSKPVVVIDSGEPDTAFPEPEADKTTGKACANKEECDTTGNGYAFCLNGDYFIIGPLNPTGVCGRYGSADDPVCDPSTDTQLKFCDDGTGLCTQSGTNPATCDPMCKMNLAGTFTTPCAGKNSCTVNGVTVGDDGKPAEAIGTCQGGCQTDADCPAYGSPVKQSKCDTAYGYCVKPCATDAECKAGWSTAPAEWLCDTTRGACHFKATKQLGEACAADTDCICWKAEADPAGACITFCKTGGTDTCGTGYTCDPLLSPTDDKGAAIWGFTAVPAGLAGYCLKTCTADTECLPGHVCGQSAGITGKTCRLKPSGT